jgi:hypothetical protein
MPPEPAPFLALTTQALAALVSLHAAHRAWLLARWARACVTPAPSVPGTLPDVALPFVTVQLPVRDERDVVVRLIDAVAALDWPHDRLEIQLLDDSSDDTGEVAAPALVRAAARGIAVAHVRRGVPTGFKAGALAEGLARARGDLVAIFDADFVPAPDFLRRVVPHLTAPDVGFVQARWEHLDAGAGALAAGQSLLLDAHFRIEHRARAHGGWFNFNGTAGVWRRAAIVAAGGWEGDTLTEDLDLSYRAQLTGWRGVYLDDVGVPGELPGTMPALLAQQRRWAKGSIEVARKLTGRIVRGPSGALVVRAEALAHLWANVAWLPALGLLVLLPVAAWMVLPAHGGDSLPARVALPVGGAMLLHVGFLLVASRGRAPWRVLPALLLGVGLTVSQARATWAGLRGRTTAFVRTPKTGGGAGSYRAARLGRRVERSLAAWSLVGAAGAALHGRWELVLVELLAATGLAWVGWGK